MILLFQKKSEFRASTKTRTRIFGERVQRLNHYYNNVLRNCNNFIVYLMIFINILENDFFMSDCGNSGASRLIQ